MKNKKVIKNSEKKTQKEIELLRQSLSIREIRERKLQRVMIVWIAAAGIFLVLGIPGWVKNSQSQSEVATAQSNFYQTVINLGTAEAKSDEAQNQIQITSALNLALKAQKIFEVEDLSRETSVLLAIQSMNMFASGEAARVLHENNLALPISVNTDGGIINSLKFSPNGRYIVSGDRDGIARVLLAETGKEITRIVHKGVIWVVDFNSNGNYIIAGGCEQYNGSTCIQGFVQISDAFTGKEISHIAHEDNVTFALFSPDSKYIVSGGCDKNQDANQTCSEKFARVWEVATGKEVMRLNHKQYVSSASFSSDGKYVVSGGCDDQIYNLCNQGFVRVWDISSGREIASMQHDNFVASVDFSPDGKYIVSGSYDRTARVWKVSSATEINRVVYGSYVISVDFSEDGNYVMSTDGTIVDIRDTVSGRNIVRLAPPDRVEEGFFSIDGKSVITSGSKSLRLWDMKGQEFSRVIYGDEENSIAVSPNGDLLAVGSTDGVIRTWSATNQNNIRKINHDRFVTSYVFTSDGQYAASQADDNTFYIWHLSTGKQEFSKYFGFHIDSMDFSDNGKQVAVVACFRSYDWEPCSENSAIVFDVSSGKQIGSFRDANRFFSIAFSFDGRRIVLGNQASFSVWDVFDNQEISRITFENPYNGWYSLISKFSSDGKYVASAEQVIHIWESSTGKIINEIAPDFNLSAISFSPNGQYIVAGGYSPIGYGVVAVWDALSGKEIFRDEINLDVRSVAFSSDNNYLVSGGADVIRVWHVSSGQEISRMVYDGVNSVAFVDNDNYVISGSYFGTLHLWKWRPEDLIADACSRVTRNLTRFEWKQYIGDILPYQVICPNLPIEAEAPPILFTTPTAVPRNTPIP